MNRKLVLFALVCAVVAAPVFAATYIVPPDSEMIQRADAIVVATAISSHSELNAAGGPHTITELRIERVLKGDVVVGDTLRLTELGGQVGEIQIVVFGAPRYRDGQQYLVFAEESPDGSFRTWSFGLGKFELVHDLDGRWIAQHSVDSDVNGWDSNLEPYVDRARDASGFLAYISGLLQQRISPEPSYFIDVRQVQMARRPVESKTEVTAQSSFTMASYLGIQGQLYRWPGSGPSLAFLVEGTAPGGLDGPGAITVGTTAWTNDPNSVVSYSKGATADTSVCKGGLSSSDGKSCVYLDDPFNELGSFKGGIGGVTKTGGASPLPDGSGSAFPIQEVDLIISKNFSPVQQNCLNTVVTHELGHTLGFRHANMNASDTAFCAAPADCSNSAIMVGGTDPVTHGAIPTPCSFNGVLQTWDHSAVATVYPPPCTTPASISVQPTGGTINQGDSTSLSVTAAGTSPFTYQWYVGNPPSTTTPVASGTTASINVSPSSTTTYWVQVNNCVGSPVNSNAATVTVTPCTPPQINTQPTGSTITFGSSAQLSVAATGSGALSYQWYVGAKGNTAAPVFNGTTASISVSPQSTTSYWARITSSSCSPPADSNAATVTVNCLTPQVNATPTSQTISQGSSTIFSAVATGGPNMTFQWYRGTAPDTSTPVPGQTSSSITVSPSVTTSYWVQASVSGCGTASSNTVTVIVTPSSCAPVTISTPTATQNGASYTLTASASSTAPPVTITWFQQTNNGQTQIGTGTSISVSPTVTTTYLAQAQNGCGSTNSAIVTVTIGQTCTPPTLTQPPDQVITSGTLTTITVVASGSGTLHYQWYRGSAGDTSVPIGTDSSTLVTPSLTATGNFWVKVTNDCSASTNSATVTIAVVQGRHRAVQH